MRRRTKFCNIMVPRRMLKPSIACLVAVVGIAGLYSFVYSSYGEKVLDVIDTVDEEVADKVRNTDTGLASELDNIEDPFGDLDELASELNNFEDQHTDDAGRPSVARHNGARGTATGEPAHHQTSQSVTPADGRLRAAAGAPIDLDAHDVDADELFRRLVVVTAFSDNHRLEALVMIGTAQTSMSATRIIVYDLGIESRRLHNETLDEFGAIFWADASVRFIDSLRSLVPFAKQHHGYLAKIHSYRTWTKTRVPHNYHFTLQGTFDYFGINKTEYALSTHAAHPAANRQLLINSSTVQEKVVRPLYACAMNETCISPPGAKRGNHQFDASALMLVLYKYLPKEFSRTNDHWKKFGEVMTMHRYWDDWDGPKARYCKH